jgi:hypothetical protein
MRPTVIVLCSAVLLVSGCAPAGNPVTGPGDHPDYPTSGARRLCSAQQHSAIGQLLRSSSAAPKVMRWNATA